MQDEIFKQAYDLKIKIKGLKKLEANATKVLNSKNTLNKIFIDVENNEIVYIEDVELANEIAHVQKKYCEQKISQLEQNFKDL